MGASESKMSFVLQRLSQPHVLLTHLSLGSTIPSIHLPITIDLLESLIDGSWSLAAKQCRREKVGAFSIPSHVSDVFAARFEKLRWAPTTKARIPLT